MTRTRILASTLALVGAGMIGGLMGPVLAGASPDLPNQTVFEPRRVLDTRQTVQLKAGRPITVPLSGVPSAPFAQYAYAVGLNITVIDPEAAGYITVWASEHAQPSVSNLNFDASETDSNFAVVSTDRASVQLVASADTHVVVDLFAVMDR